MTRKPQDDQYSERDTAQRLSKILRGAFAGAPTPLKEIPTEEGKRRKLRRAKPKKAASDSRRAKAKTARPGT